MQKITVVLDQIKGNVKDSVWRCHQHIVQKHHTTYIFISSKILFLIIYWFKVCIFFFNQRSSHFKLDTCSPIGNWESRSLMWASNLSIFDTKVDRTANLSTNIWNVLEFNSIYVSDFTAQGCSKCIYKEIIIYLWKNQKNDISCKLHSK